jgi:hypothetical protein
LILAELLSISERRMRVDKYLIEISLLTKKFCPEAKVETTLESYEDEDGLRAHLSSRWI